MATFSTTEPAPIIGYGRKTPQNGISSSNGTPGTPETPIPDTFTLAGSNVVAETFTSPIAGKPSKTTNALRASRTDSDEFIVISALPPI